MKRQCIRLLLLSFMLAFLASCMPRDPEQLGVTDIDISPSITEVTTPRDQEIPLVGQPSPVESSAQFNAKSWPYTFIHFRYAGSESDLRSSQATVISNPECSQIEDLPGIQECTASFVPLIGANYFQWVVDYGANSSDVATISRPESPGRFSVLRQQSSPPPETPEPLVLFAPANGESCTGIVAGGQTVVSLDWRGRNTQEYQALPGSYQVVLEHVESPNCSSAQGLNLDNPQTAYGYTGGCWVTRTNINSTSPPPLPTNRSFQWRVRHILENGQFGPWSPNSRFTTAGPPAAPTFIDPTPDATITLSANSVSESYWIRWRVEGCPVTTFTYQLFGADPSDTNAGSGICPPGSPQECSALVILRPGNSYRFEVTQSNPQYGSTSGSLQFKVE